VKGVKPNPYNETAYAELLQVLNNDFQKPPKDVLIGLETHIEDPPASDIFLMWILGMDENVKNSIESYFSNPVGYKKGYNAGATPMYSGASPVAVETNPVRLISRQREAAELEKTGANIKSRLKEAGLSAIGDRIEIVRTSEGCALSWLRARPARNFSRSRCRS
jgi:hypothetical protein